MKLRKKIFLSATALAACAATLTTTTYAWYVSNTEAKISGITGAVSSTGADGNLLVAADDQGEAQEYSDNLNLSAYVKTPNGGLTPVTYFSAEKNYISLGRLTSDEYTAATADSAKVYTTSNGSDYTEATSYAEGTQYFKEVGKGFYTEKGEATATPSAITFRFWIVSTVDKTVTPKLTLKNTTVGNPKEQQLKNVTGAPKVMKSSSGDGAAYGSSDTAVAKNANFTSNALHAIRIGIKSVTEGADKATNDSAVTASAMSVYNPTKTTSGIKITTPEKTDAAWAYTIDGDANSYYAALLNKAPVGVFGTYTEQFKKVKFAAGTTKAEVERLIATGNYYAVSDTTYGAKITENLADTKYTKKDGESGITAEATLTADEEVYVYNGTKCTATSPDESTQTTDWTAFTLNANQARLFEFTIWLEGTDAQCFDSCKGQTFDMAFSFTC